MSTDKASALDEIAAAISEASKSISKSTSVQTSTERLLNATLEALPPTHRIENTIDVILEEDSSSD
ncbi:hypothetical protein [Pseudaestuariivita atlantica]|uniref:Uncharacterized protein n=1 Tax=Pseudaestuariivita atlantica TaxID=1317121 RepID=A0A0L1JJ38_9RHOB|nr:hypothetical protein [Pseudaestuariivita atlantica]KNG91779.1 hypothetical protein ATO11_20885 [Pseudaestuariivita atlantica]